MGTPAADGYNRSMKILVRAVISGFGFTLGAALFKKVADKLGLGEEKSASARNETKGGDPDVIISGNGKNTEQPDSLDSTGFEAV
jgi:hypothetical protein